MLLPWVHKDVAREAVRAGFARLREDDDLDLLRLSAVGGGAVDVATSQSIPLASDDGLLQAAKYLEELAGLQERAAKRGRGNWPSIHKASAAPLGGHRREGIQALLRRAAGRFGSR